MHWSVIFYLYTIYIPARRYIFSGQLIFTHHYTWLFHNASSNLLVCFYFLVEKKIECVNYYLRSFLNFSITWRKYNKEFSFVVVSRNVFTSCACQQEWCINQCPYEISFDLYRVPAASFYFPYLHNSPSVPFSFLLFSFYVLFKIYIHVLKLLFLLFNIQKLVWENFRMRYYEK